MTDQCDGERRGVCSGGPAHHPTCTDSMEDQTMTAITAAQYDFLTAPIAGSRVQNLRGQSHLEAWDIRRHLIRVFGFDGFDIETLALDLVRELESAGNGGKSRWTVVYRAQVRLTIKVDGRPVARFEDGAAGDSQNQPSLGDAHDMAMKTALSQALKRCAVNLGDQFGLSLYNGGSTAAEVKRSLVTPHPSTAPAAQLGVDDAPVAAVEEPAPPVSAPPAPAPAEVPIENTDSPEMIRPEQRRLMMALYGDLGVKGSDDATRQKRLDFIDWSLKLPKGTTQSTNDLTALEASLVIDALKARKEQQ